MTNLEKEQYFLNISDSSGVKPKVKLVGWKSIRLTLPCGCIQTQNLLCGNALKNKEQESRRFQYFEFCDKHKR